jgi:hypothetical protein
MFGDGLEQTQVGTKARQRKDTEDRSIPFRDAVREFGPPMTDVDGVITNGRDTIRLVIEYTRPDEVVYSPAAYQRAVDERRRDESKGNHNDTIIALIAKKLEVDALLVIFEPNVAEETAVVYVREIVGTKWIELPARRFFIALKEWAVNLDTTSVWTMLLNLRKRVIKEEEEKDETSIPAFVSHGVACV